MFGSDEKKPEAAPAAVVKGNAKKAPARAKAAAEKETREEAHLKAHGPTPQPCPGDYVDKRPAAVQVAESQDLVKHEDESEKK